MNRFGLLVSTAVLFCFVGTTSPAYAQQDQQDEKQTKQEEQAKPEKQEGQAKSGQQRKEHAQQQKEQQQRAKQQKQQEQDQQQAEQQEQQRAQQQQQGEQNKQRQGVPVLPTPIPPNQPLPRQEQQRPVLPTPIPPNQPLPRQEQQRPVLPTPIPPNQPLPRQEQQRPDQNKQQQQQQGERLSQQRQQQLIEQQQQRLTQYRQHLEQQQRVLQQQTAQLQEQKRMAQYRFHEDYLERLRQQQIFLQNDRHPDYDHDPYFYTAPIYRYNRGGSYYEVNQYGADLLRQALNNGYQEGFRAGQADREDRWRSDYRDSYAYQDANYGYNGYYLDRDDYNYYFREGFQRGYEDGYSSRYQYGRYSNGSYSMLDAILSQVLGFQSLRYSSGDSGQYVILSAQYGTARRHVDITNRLKDLARQDRVFRMGNSTFGVDPDPGQVKTLRIYARGPNGQERMFEYREGSTVDGSQFSSWGSGDWGNEPWSGRWEGQERER